MAVLVWYHCFGLCFRLYRRTTNPKTATTTVKITNSKSAILNSRLLLMSGHTARARANSTRSHRFVRMTLAIDFPLVNSRRPLRHGQPTSDWGAQTGNPRIIALANTGNCGESQDPQSLLVRADEIIRCGVRGSPAPTPAGCESWTAVSQRGPQAISPPRSTPASVRPSSSARSRSTRTRLRAS
jgi:hypothetical protein